MVLNPGKLGEIFENYTRKLRLKASTPQGVQDAQNAIQVNKHAPWKLEAILLTSYYLILTTNNIAGRNC